jgi:hypothetical protein
MRLRVLPGSASRSLMSLDTGASIKGTTSGLTEVRPTFRRDAVRDLEENKANRFAAELLVPRRAFDRATLGRLGRPEADIHGEISLTGDIVRCRWTRGAVAAGRARNPGPSLGRPTRLGSLALSDRNAPALFGRPLAERQRSSSAAKARGSTLNDRSWSSREAWRGREGATCV